jgi:hypothetical protein
VSLERPCPGLLVSNRDLRSNDDRVVERKSGHADRDAGVCADFRPVEVNDQVREAIDGVRSFANSQDRR